jgi:hypothetical protein
VPLTNSITDFAAGHVRSGRRIAGKVPLRDALSSDSQQRHDYQITFLPHADDEAVAGEVRDALAHRVPGPAEEAIFNLDYEAWLDSLTQTQRQVARDLQAGLNLTEIAQQRGVSRAAVQQVASRLRQSYEAFQSKSLSPPSRAAIPSPCRHHRSSAVLTTTRICSCGGSLTCGPLPRQAAQPGAGAASAERPCCSFEGNITPPGQGNPAGAADPDSAAPG